MHMKAMTFIALGAIGAAAQASILTFDLPGLAGSGEALPADYGDRISGMSGSGVGGVYGYGMGNGFTPNVTVDYAYSFTGTPSANELARNGNRHWRDSEWNGVHFTRGVGTTTVVYDTIFTPDPGFGVRVNSFELDDYASFRAGHTVDWFVYAGSVDPGNLLASGQTVVAADTTSGNSDNTLVSTGLSGFHFGTLILRIDHVAGGGNDLAMDNVNFDQIPTPATALGLVGLLGLSRRRR
jgi:hypothetical protein